MHRLELADVPDEAVTRYGLGRLPVDRAATATADLLRLDGKCAVVTGGGGDGLGNAICHRLAEQGATVVILDIDAQAATHTATEIRRRYGTTAVPLTVDVASSVEVDRAVERIEGEVGRIDVLVNNVGGVGRISATDVRPPTMSGIDQMTAAQIDVSVALNLVSALYLSRAVVASMLRDDAGGRIVFISSEFGRIGSANASVYSACKAALIGLTRALAREVGPRGVSPVCVAPGLLVGQRMLDSLTDRHAPRAPFEFALERSSIGRAAVVDEVASVVGFLVSPAGAYVHGTTISVGGGMSD
ncbi:MAG: short-chain dehydrogenase/reductase [Pseudonocardiales bacterium]|nr:short-chain dehydrogenase/reductase [Pseudonocardiales bacterium]